MDRIALRRAVSGLGMVASMLLSTLPASAETPQQRDWCNGKGGVTPEMRVRGCTAYIENRNHGKAQLANAFNSRGAAYAAEEDWDRALSDYSTSIDLDPTVASTFYNRGLAYLHMADYERAIADFDQALERDPALAQALSDRGSAYRNKGEYDRAIADYDQAIRVDPLPGVAAVPARFSVYPGFVLFFVN